MKTLVRKLAITGGAAAVLLAAGGTTATITAHAAGQTALHCAITGNASISPGLGAPPGSPQSFTFNGTAKCDGLVAGVVVNATNTGVIAGSGSCPSGSLATCAGVLPPISASISFSSLGVSLSGSGTYVQTGPNITVELSGSDSGGGAVTAEADAVFATTSPSVPVQNVTFAGTATAHTS